MNDLQEAHNAGKIVSSVLPADEETGGYLVVFSDGTSITLSHGADGINGNDGADGTDGKDGADGQDGMNGKDGADGQDGTDGKDGIDGTDGTDGKDGADGQDGMNGKDGIDGRDGITPLVRIDSSGCWEASYDNGSSYIPILDNSGNPISAVGQNGVDGTDGLKGEPGDKGASGEKGDKGDSGICVRVTIEEGKYVFQLYSPDQPDAVIQTVPTPYCSDPASVLQSIVEDARNGIITITMADGTEFRFNLDVSYPTSVILLTGHLDIVGKDGSGTFEFRLNPSNSFMNFVWEGADPNIQLDRISVTRSGDAGSYVTVPSNYHITGVTPSVNETGERKVGQYTVTVKSDAVDSDGEETVALVITTRDGRGEQIQLSSTLMTVSYDTRPQIFGISVAGIDAYRVDDSTYYVKLPYGTDTGNVSVDFDTNSEISAGDVTRSGTIDLSNPVTLTATLNGVSREYTLIACYSNLPIIYVSTPSPVTSKDDWVKNSTIQIANAGDYNLKLDKVQIKGRGNSTWTYPKKPYAIKLDKKAEVLGMPKHKRWCLLANWMDRTDIRNDIAFEIGRRMSGLAWTPRGKFIELVFNGKFVGNYYLCEQIKIDPNRVDIDEMSENDISGDELTGGYLLELDSYFDEVNKFRSDILNLPVNFKDPDEDVLQTVQFEYLKNYFNEVETKLYNHASYSEIESLIDIDSFIDWWLLQELALNREANHPKSSYMYKVRNGKLFAGPAWDYDWGTFIDYSGWWSIKTSIWYRFLFTYIEFIEEVKKRWQLHRSTLNTIPDYIDSVGKLISESAKYDCQIWPINQSVNGDEQLSFTESVERLKDNYIKRFNWIDDNIDKLQVDQN